MIEFQYVQQLVSLTTRCFIVGASFTFQKLIQVSFFHNESLYLLQINWSAMLKCTTQTCLIVFKENKVSQFLNFFFLKWTCYFLISVSRTLYICIRNSVKFLTQIVVLIILRTKPESRATQRSGECDICHTRS